MGFYNIQLLKESFDSVEAQRYVGYNRYIIETYLNRRYPDSDERRNKVGNILDTISFLVSEIAT